MPSYRIITLGCKVNQYESLQISQTLDSRGYVPAKAGVTPDVVIVNTCSVTSSAASKSRNLLRRFRAADDATGRSPLVIAVGCWSTSDRASAAQIVGDPLVLTHKDDFGSRLSEILGDLDKPGRLSNSATPGAASLPLLHQRQPDNQRAILKIQDGCDAHCTYCIIPKLRSVLWSKPIEDVVQEARQLVAAGHHEIVLTGVFLGAYEQPTALHRRQIAPASGLAKLVRRLCTEVDGMLRLRLSSLEPGDVTPALVEELASHPQVMPHFHLPLQSGSDQVLRRMNRQYTSADYLAMVDRLAAAFDRPAITTDLIVGFPSETDDDFQRTLEIAARVKFLHMHAFPFSPREGTAAARWKDQFVHQQTVTDRMKRLEEESLRLDLAYRSQFLGEVAQILVERQSPADAASGIRHGRSERYFPIHFQAPQPMTGQLVSVRITRVSPQRTHGELRYA